MRLPGKNSDNFQCGVGGIFAELKPPFEFGIISTQPGVIIIPPYAARKEFLHII